MILYLDTSAMLKLYIEEEISAQVRSVTSSANGVFTHIVAYAEMRAAFAKALRMKRVTRKALDSLQDDFEADWSRINLIEVQLPMVRRAGELAERFDLRGYDSVHLAAAEWAYGAAGRPGDFLFVAFDQVLCTGADQLGIGLLPSAVNQTKS